MDAEKVAWLHENNGAFVLSWVTQVVQVFTLATVFAATCWKVYRVTPMAAVSVGILRNSLVQLCSCQASKVSEKIYKTSNASTNRRHCSSLYS